MAIKVGGTTVIDDSRNFTNIAGGFKTVNGTSVVGSGNISAGASTSTGATGTYGFFSTNTNKSPGNTVSGSSLKWTNAQNYDAVTSPTISGTWQSMGVTYGQSFGYSEYSSTLFVRIS